MKVILAPVLLLLSGLPLAADCVAPDADGDGYNTDVDCDDTNASTFPGAPEVCGDGLDNNCDGVADEGCPAVTLTALQRQSEVYISCAEGEGGHVFDGYDQAVGTSELGPFEGELEDGGVYFSSGAAQVSFAGEGRVRAWMAASAGARDDVGYGFGYADGESSFTTRFELSAPAVVEVTLRIGEDLGHDGGDAEASVGLSRDGAPLLAFSSNQGDQDTGQRLQLLAGIYDVAVSARAWVDLGGGGDAYPSAAAEVDFDLGLAPAP